MKLPSAEAVQGSSVDGANDENISYFPLTLQFHETAQSTCCYTDATERSPSVFTASYYSPDPHSTPNKLPYTPLYVAVNKRLGFTDMIGLEGSTSTERNGTCPQYNKSYHYSSRVSFNCPLPRRPQLQRQ